jgi:hypothetical protein
MDFLCIICNKRGGDLCMLTPKGLETIINSSKEVDDDLHCKLSIEHASDYRVHNDCRRRYNDKRSFAKRRQSNQQAIEDKGAQVDEAASLQSTSQTIVSAGSAFNICCTAYVFAFRLFII